MASNTLPACTINENLERPRRPNGLHLQSITRGLQKFLSEGHIGNYTTVWRPGILRNAVVSGCITFYQINKLFVNRLLLRYWQNIFAAGWNGFSGRVWPAAWCLLTIGLDLRVSKCRSVRNLLPVRAKPRPNCSKNCEFCLTISTVFSSLRNIPQLTWSYVSRFQDCLNRYASVKI